MKAGRISLALMTRLASIGTLQRSPRPRSRHAKTSTAPEWSDGAFDLLGMKLVPIFSASNQHREVVVVDKPPF